MSKKQWLKENLKKGEQYAGIILGKNLEQDYHLILLDGEAQNVTWYRAQGWAIECGGSLPDRCEQSLLFANLKEAFYRRCYWSNTQDSDYESRAWMQGFYNGGQDADSKGYKFRARAVRRIYIEED